MRLNKHFKTFINKELIKRKVESQLAQGKLVEGLCELRS